MNSGFLTLDSQQNPAWIILADGSYERVSDELPQDIILLSGLVSTSGHTLPLNVKKHSFLGTSISLLNELPAYSGEKIIGYSKRLLKDVDEVFNELASLQIEIKTSASLQPLLIKPGIAIERPQAALVGIFEEGFNLPLYQHPKIPLDEYLGIQWFSVFPELKSFLEIQVPVTNHFKMYPMGKLSIDYLSNQPGMTEVMLKKPNEVLGKIQTKKFFWMPNSLLPFLKKVVEFRVGKSFIFTESLKLKELHPCLINLVVLCESNNLVAQSVFKTFIEGLMPKSTQRHSFVSFSVKAFLVAHAMQKARDIFNSMPMDFAHPVSIGDDGKIALRIGKANWNEFFSVAEKDSSFFSLDAIINHYTLQHKRNHPCLD